MTEYLVWKRRNVGSECVEKVVLSGQEQCKSKGVSENEQCSNNGYIV
jgi:hypothetical protein